MSCTDYSGRPSMIESPATPLPTSQNSWKRRVWWNRANESPGKPSRKQPLPKRGVGKAKETVRSTVSTAETSVTKNTSVGRNNETLPKAKQLQPRVRHHGPQNPLLRKKQIHCYGCHRHGVQIVVLWSQQRRFQ
jgi:hypothetical protein